MIRIRAAILLASFLPALGTARAQTAAQAPPVVSNQPPVRFVLGSGTVVVGTQIGEDAEFLLVQTANGPVRIRKADLARIEMRPPPDSGAGAATPIAAQRPDPTVIPAPAPIPVAEEEDEDDDGRAGMMLQALGAFALAYGLTAILGAIVSASDPEGVWLYTPAVGPGIFWARTDTTIDVEGGLYLSLSMVVQTGAILYFFVALFGGD